MRRAISRQCRFQSRPAHFEGCVQPQTECKQYAPCAINRSLCAHKCLTLIMSHNHYSILTPATELNGPSFVHHSSACARSLLAKCTVTAEHCLDAKATRLHWNCKMLSRLINLHQGNWSGIQYWRARKRLAVSSSALGQSPCFDGFQMTLNSVLTISNVSKCFVYTFQL